VAEANWTERLPRMLEVLAHLTQPDATYAPLGDTDRRPVRFADDHPALRWLATDGADGTPPTETFVSYPAGFTVARSGWGVDRPAAEETYLALRHGPARALHGQHDHGALLLFAEGQPLLTDPGKYAYGATAERAHVLSAAAHNRLTLEPCAASGASSEVVDIERTATTDRVSIEVADCAGARWIRTVAFLRHSGTTVVLDEVDADAAATQRWQLEPGAEVEVHSPAVVDATWPSGARLAIEQLLPVAETSVVAGGRDPLRGWVSQAYAQLTPAPNLATVAADGPRRDLVTVLRPGLEARTQPSRITTDASAYRVIVHDGTTSHEVTLPRRLAP
ncbi:MAG: heparinase II/III family protein, partial [Nitriliruptoraceae bacterium]